MAFIGSLTNHHLTNDILIVCQYISGNEIVWNVVFAKTEPH
jgi:hypothetical protein